LILRAFLTRDRLCGIVVALAGLLVLAEAATYPMGELVRMGPGYLPVAFGVLLSAFGAAILIEGWSDTGTVQPVRLRPILAVVSGLAAWVLLAEDAGFIVATSVLIVLSSLAEPGFRPLPTLALALGVSVVGGLIFVVGLSVPLPLLPF
jgi:hypothetical protein